MARAEAASASARSDSIKGLAQSIALVPGISRAGITISAGLFAGLLFGIVRHQAAQMRQNLNEFVSTGLEWREIALVAGDDESALAGLGVLQLQQRAIDRRHYLERVIDVIAVVFQEAVVAERDDAAEHQGDHDGQRADQGGSGQHRAQRRFHRLLLLWPRESTIGCEPSMRPLSRRPPS